MSKRVFTSEQEIDVINLYNSGLSSIRISKLYGVDKTSVLGVLKRNGIGRRDNKGMGSEEEAQVVQLYRDGYSTLQIEQMLPFERGSIRGALTRQGVKLRDNRAIWRDEDVATVLDMYSDGMSIAEIEQETNFGHKAIRSTLERNKIPLRSPRFFNDDDDSEIAEMYASGLSVRQIADRYGLKNMKSVKNSLYRSDVEMRGCRTYTFNDHALDDLTQEASLYILGFIYADGYVDNAGLRFGLAIKDYSQLEFIKGHFESDAPIFSDERVCVFSVYSSYLRDYLRSLGIVPKRGQFQLTKQAILSGYERAFILGFLDGDGTISRVGSIRFLGQPDILSWIREVLVYYANVSPVPAIRPRKGIHTIGWGGYIQGSRVAHYLYDDATVYMDRKRDRAMTWMR